MTRPTAPWRRVFLAACLLAAAATAAMATTTAWAQDKITIAGGVDVSGLNAVDVYTVFPDRSLMDQIGDTVLRREKEGVLGPWLATSWSMVDPVTWEFKLRPGVKFTNGEPVDATSIKTFYDLILDPASKAPMRAIHAGYLKEFQIVDDLTFRLITKQPFPALLPQMAAVYAVPPNYIKEVGLDGYRRKPVGTGPYRLTEMVKDTRTTLAAVDGWWGGPQKVKTIIYRPIPEAASRVAALMTGEVDLAMDIPPELKPMLARAKNVKVKTAITGRVYILHFNTLNPAYATAKREVREAINYAIDREQLSKEILDGVAEPSAWLNPDMFGVNPAIKPIPYDPERARKLLAEAGYPNGIDITLDSPNGRYIKDKELAEAISGQLAKAGIRMKVVTYEWGVLQKRYFSHQTSEMVMTAYGDYTGDPQSPNETMMRTGAVSAQHSDPVLDEIIGKIAVEMDVEKRKALVYQEQERMNVFFPKAFLLRIGVVAGASAKLDWWQPRGDERYYFYTNALIK